MDSVAAAGNRAWLSHENTEENSDRLSAQTQPGQALAIVRQELGLGEFF